MARRTSYYYISVVEHTFLISGPSSVQGKSLNLTSTFDGNDVQPTWSITSGNNYATINQNGKVFIESGSINNVVIVSASYVSNNRTYTATKSITVTYDNELIIESPATITGTEGNIIVKFNSENITSSATITVTSGSSHINNGIIGSTGAFTILDSGSITVQVSYLGYTATKTIQLVYSNTSATTIVENEDGSITTETSVETTDPNTGDVTTESTSTTMNEDGSSSSTTSTTTTATDGSSFTSSTTINSDGTSSSTQSTTSVPDATTGSTTTQTQTTNSDGTSSESTVINNTDGSYSGSTTNFDENGDPVRGENVEGDTSGNISTQEIGYDSEGNEVITGYNIDTTGNENGEKNFNGDGVNTEFYGFDMTDGFVLNMHFIVDVTNNPAGQNENHHQILTMKRADPEPWYGFQLRQSNNNKYIILGTQFESGSNINTQITPQRWVQENKLAEYNIQIVYDPSAATDKFICKELIGNTTVYTSNKLFPDIEELKYLTVCVGYGLDSNGDPYRYSKIDVLNFQITKLSRISTPEITCDGEEVSITCSTIGADIYYRVNDGEFAQYTAPFSINATTTVEAYSTLSTRTTATVSEVCRYVPPTLYPPVITCNGTQVSITCATQNATIMYRLNESGNFLTYTTPIAISEDVTVEAYSVLDNRTSNTITENCEYNFVIEQPVIYCDGEYVSIVCDTPSVTIWYKLDSGNYIEYSDSFPINATTIVEAYAELNGHSSLHTTETCVYSPVILVSPVVTCNGSQVTITCATQGATIMYKLDGTGSYTQYTEPIPILADTVVETYSTIHGRTSSIVTETCVYNPVHDYSQDYLTFRVLTGGTIIWNSIGSGFAKTIQYSINDGEWTSLLASSSSSINVSQNDVVRFKGTESSYAKDKSNYSGFQGGTATFDIEGNIHSLLYGDNFIGNDTLPNYSYIFCSIFKMSNVISAENLILPATTLKGSCYRAMFSKASSLTTAPALPATTLEQYCYYYMFEETAITTAPELPATSLAQYCYGSMFTGCSNLNFIKCLATNRSAMNCLQNWTKDVSATGTFVKDGNTTWNTGLSGIPSGWVIQNDSVVVSPVISYDGFDTITITCVTQDATIYYRLNNTGNYSVYSSPITINATTTIEAYSTFGGNTSTVTLKKCVYVSNVPIEASNRILDSWTYNGNMITTPYSVNQIDGHSSSYAKGTFNFETSFALREAQPTYLWFQHADQSADIYVDNVKVDTHWGGYNAFFSDISNYVHQGTNNIKVALCNQTRSTLAPAAGDFNFNATLGNVKLLTSPCLPATKYGYDGFHVTSNVTSSSATVYVNTTIPSGSSVVCTIDDGTYNWSDTKISDGEEMTFYTTIQNPHLWNGISDPHMYTITLEISKNGTLYHRFQRDYGLRYYSYVINDENVLVNNNPYTGFLLNGQPYYLRGVCMHDDLDGKANALNAADYTQEFAIIHELGCNFIRLAHYPHPKEVYDWCDRLGIIVQTEVPCVNKMQSTMPEDYYTHLEGQYRDMVNQHYNHPCIMFWGLSNETTTDDKTFAKAKIENYASIIKSLDSERLVGYVMSHSYDNPSGYYNDPSCVDWFGGNIYTGWYIDTNSNNPTTRLNSRINNTVNRISKPFAYSEYGCGGTQHCHSDAFLNTTTRGNHERHDIEYQMWLHEGQLAAIRNFPQLLFTAEWQLFDIAVANRNEGYTVCLDGETVSTDDSLRRLNNKGLVERDHVTKKDTFYLYKAEWNNTDKFIHICGKDYTKTTDRVIKCYTNDGSSAKLYVNGTLMETVNVTDHIALFTSRTFNSGDVVRVDGATTSTDTFTF